MKQRLSLPLIAAIVAALIVGMLMLSYLLSTNFYGTGSEPPPLSAPSAQEDDGTLGAQAVTGVVITPENVQAVIAVLARAPGYTQTVSSTLYYNGTSSTQTVNQYVLGDVCRTDVLHAGGAVAECYLRAGESFYAWENGSTSVFRGAAGDFSADSMAMLPDWQTVTALPAESITAAESAAVDGEPTLCVSTEQGSKTAEYEISAISGLLRAARYYTDGELTREIRVSGVSMDEPDRARFTLPSGTSVLAEETAEP